MDELRVAGFRFAGEIVGIKQGSRKDRPDLGLILADAPAAAAGVFTQNRLRAAPVDLSAKRLKRGLCQAVVVNSGNANACTGEVGRTDAREMAALVAEAAGVDAKLVCVASTGVIGEPLPMDKLREGVPRAVAAADAGGWDRFSRAILTTDKGPKLAWRVIQLDDRTVTIAGCAKGAGMIAPNLATSLAFVATDAAADALWLDEILREAADASFNRVTVDGDTSTNDSLFLLASGAAGGKPLKKSGRRGVIFEEALRAVLLELATALVRDGEGATRVVEVRVDGAGSNGDARRVARRIADSPLVKTAIHGADPNWGRVLCAIGNADAAVDPEAVDLDIGDVPVVRGGVGVRAADTEARAHAVMLGASYVIRVGLNLGHGAASVVTCDLTAEYVRINADYRS